MLVQRTCFHLHTMFESSFHCKPFPVFFLPCRATTALRVTFVIPSQLQPHFEVLPEQGLIQGESSFAAQLKFLPQENIYDGKCNKFLDPTTGNLSVPIQVIVAGQVRSKHSCIHTHLHMHLHVYRLLR